MKMKITYLIFGFVLCLIVSYCSDLIQCEFLTREHYDEFKDVWETNSMIGEMLTFKVLEYETCDVAKVYYITDVSGNVLTFAWDDGAWKEVSWNTIWSKQGNADDVLAPYFWYSAYFRFPNQHGNNS